MANPDALDGLGAAALARLGEAQQVLARLTQLNHLVRDRPPGETLNITRNATPIATTRATVGAAADLLSCLTAGTQPVTVLDAALRWISGLLYPVENLQYTEPLAYYRQREWRILANAVHEGIPISRTPTSDDIRALLALDAEFFGRELDFPTGRRRRVDECQFLSAVCGRPVMDSVRRVIVPHAVGAEVERLMNERALRYEVTSLESLAQSDG